MKSPCTNSNEQMKIQLSDAKKSQLPRKNASITGHPVERNVRHNSREQSHFKICKAVKCTQKIMQQDIM